MADEPQPKEVIRRLRRLLKEKISRTKARRHEEHKEERLRKNFNHGKHRKHGNKRRVFESILTSWNNGLFIIALMKINFQLALSKIPVRLHRIALKNRKS